MGMSLGRSKLYDRGEVAELGDVAAAAVSPLGAPASGSLVEANRAIDTLRAINSQLVRQIAALKEREAQAQRLADRDALTGLFNRRKMGEILERCVSDASQQNHRVGALFIDLDGFKAVNDHLGHAAGDQLLVTVGSRIAARARHGDFVCRYGGDEFLVILPRIADGSSAHQVADSIGRRVALPYRIDGADVHVTAAIGVAIYPDAARSAADLLRLADASMYRAKSQRRNPREDLVPAPARRRDDKSRHRPLS
jgi:diguanylate cyclase (GGDEF)-like protein